MRVIEMIIIVASLWPRLKSKIPCWSNQACLLAHFSVYRTLFHLWRNKRILSQKIQNRPTYILQQSIGRYWRNSTINLGDSCCNPFQDPLFDCNPSRQKETWANTMGGIVKPKTMETPYYALPLSGVFQVQTWLQNKLCRMKVVQCIVNIAHIVTWAILTMCNVTFFILSWKRCSLNIVWAAKLRGGRRGGECRISNH